MYVCMYVYAYVHTHAHKRKQKDTWNQRSPKDLVMYRVVTPSSTRKMCIETNSPKPIPLCP